MGPDEGVGDEEKGPDMLLDEWLSREGPGDRRDDLYEGDW